MNTTLAVACVVWAALSLIALIAMLGAQRRDDWQ